MHFPFVPSPELCPECREGLLCQQQRDLREYTQATIYIHKVVDNKKVRALSLRPRSSRLRFILTGTAPSTQMTVRATGLAIAACRVPAGLGPAGGDLGGPWWWAGQKALGSAAGGSSRFGENSKWENSGCSYSEKIWSPRSFLLPNRILCGIFTDL